MISFLICYAVCHYTMSIGLVCGACWVAPSNKEEKKPVVDHEHIHVPDAGEDWDLRWEQSRK